MQSGFMPITCITVRDVPFVLFKSSNSLLRLASRGLSAKTVAKSISVSYTPAKAVSELNADSYNRTPTKARTAELS